MKPADGYRELRWMVAVLFLVIICPDPAISGESRETAAMTAKTSEEAAIRNAAMKYLDAEKRRDFTAVYAMLAPSSAYVRTHTWEEYLAEARVSPIFITEYRVISITDIRENRDRKTYPAIEAFARVEVELKLFARDTSTYETINILFTFIKEGGAWLKG